MLSRLLSAPAIRWPKADVEKTDVRCVLLTSTLHTTHYTLNQTLQSRQTADTLKHAMHSSQTLRDMI